MQDILQRFIDEYIGRIDVGNTPENKGQCVGLVSVYMDRLGISHEWGNAKDLLNNADPAKFQVIHNDPNDINQFPKPGDIMVFDETWGNGNGHTGIITQADGTSFDLFEQNDKTNVDQNGACMVLHHNNYNGVLGWLSPITEPKSLDTHGLDPNNQESLQAVYDTWFAVSQNKYISREALVPVLTLLNLPLDASVEAIEEAIRNVNTAHQTAQSEKAQLQEQVQQLPSQVKMDLAQKIVKFFENL